MFLQTSVNIDTILTSSRQRYANDLPTTTMAAVHSDSPIDADEVVRCFRHGLKAALLTSHTVTNPNR